MIKIHSEAAHVNPRNDVANYFAIAQSDKQPTFMRISSPGLS